MVDLESVIELLGYEGIDINSGVVQTPDIDGVEPEICLWVGAVCICIVTIPAAVTSEVDGVEVFHAQRLLSSLEGTCEDGGIGIAGIADEVGRGCQGQVSQVNLSSRCVSVGGLKGLEVLHTLRKYRSSTVLLRSMVPAMNTNTVQMRTAMVRRKGAVIQHIRPAETMMATVNGIQEVQPVLFPV